MDANKGLYNRKTSYTHAITSAPSPVAESFEPNRHWLYAIIRENSRPFAVR